MKVALVTRAGGPEVLETRTVEDPSPAEGEVLVAVGGASINPTDLGARQGRVPSGSVEPPYVLGWDFAGEVVDLGAGVTDVAIGERVVGMIPWYVEEGRRGAYAERVAVPREWVVPLPEGADVPTMATIPLNALTAVQLLEALDAPEGSAVLVTGASGGVGSFVVQLAKRQGLRVTGIAGTDDEDFVRSLEPDEVLPRDIDLETVGPFRFVVDAVPLGDAALPAVADGGRVVETRPSEGEPPRGIERISMLVRPDFGPLPGLVADVADGSLVTRLDRTMPLDDAAEAHRVVENEHLRGKVVLVP